MDAAEPARWRALVMVGLFGGALTAAVAAANPGGGPTGCIHLCPAVWTAYQQYGAPLLVGAPAVDASPGRGVVQYNRVYLLGPDGREQSRYDKQVLVPFGEYVPTSWLAARVAALAPAAAPIRAGSPAALPLLATRAGVLVCYENAFAWLARRAVRDGARLLMNPSNDAWYAHTAAPAQQLAHVVLRAVELGVPVVRAALGDPAGAARHGRDRLRPLGRPLRGGVHGGDGAGARCSSACMTSRIARSGRRCGSTVRVREDRTRSAGAAMPPCGGRARSPARATRGVPGVASSARSSWTRRAASHPASKSLMLRLGAAC